MTLLAPVVATVAGCLSLSAAVSSAQPRPQYDQYELSEGIRRSEQGCQFAYRVFEPATPISPSTVMMGHGFLRNQDRLIALSRALANAGIRTVTLNFCNMQPWNGNHRANAADMRNLAAELDRVNDVIFAGFSAGALAAILASDQRTKAIFLLDFVDQSDLGATALASLGVPLSGLHGPPSDCNANNAGKVVIDDYLATRKNIATGYELIESASHCEFESPSNWLCNLVCSDNDSPSDNETTRQLIIDQSVDKIKHLLSEQNRFTGTS